MKSVLAALYHGIKILEKQLFFFFKKKPFILAPGLRGFSPCLASPGPVARQSVTAEGWDRAARKRSHRKREQQDKRNPTEGAPDGLFPLSRHRDWLYPNPTNWQPSLQLLNRKGLFLDCFVNLCFL